MSLLGAVSSGLRQVMHGGSQVSIIVGSKPSKSGSSVNHLTADGLVSSADFVNFVSHCMVLAVKNVDMLLESTKLILQSDNILA